MWKPLRFFLGALIASAALFGAASRAHDIPGKVTVHIYVKPQNQQLLVLVRVPMEAFSEIQFPLRGPGYLDFSKADRALGDAAQVYLTQTFHVYADGVPLGDGKIEKLRVALPSDKAFVDFDTALANINRPPLTNDEELIWKQAYLDMLLVFPIVSDAARFSIETSLERLAMETHTVLRYLPPNKEEAIFEYTGNPGVIQLEPGWWHSVSHFTVMGFFHILDGIDHLLFLFCLVIPARSVRALIPVITAFTIAHSISLISSAYGLTPTSLWFPPLIEVLIALSVFYMACENILGPRLQRRWLVVFGFGLIHGFGFSFILADRMQFAGKHLISALFAFNVGVELGQLLVLLVAVPLLILFFRLLARTNNAGSVEQKSGVAERIGAILLSALVAHSAWHWLTERTEQLLKFSWSWPTLDAGFFAALFRWLMLLMVSVAVLWLLNQVFARFARVPTAPSDRSAG